MPARHLPVRPDLDQLKHQAKDLLHAIRAGEPDALADLAHFHPKQVDPANVRLADAQLVLARSYHAPSWPRLVQACRLIDAIWRDDLETVLALVRKHPRLLHEPARIRDGNWGPPLSYAANLGRDRIILALHQLGAADLMHGLGRAALQSRIETARMLHGLLGAPQPPDNALGGPAYTLSVSGTSLLLELGARVRDEHGARIAPVDVVLETDSRRPAAKHEILELYARHGIELPDTPTMAIHRGRTDLLEQHLARDPGLLRRTFTAEEIYPRSMGCRDEGTARTPLAGGTLLHLTVDCGELDLARWLLDRGMDADAAASVDGDGFGGHTALFCTLVSYPNFWMNYGQRGPFEAEFARLLLDRGADPNARASLRELVEREGHPTELREHREITPLEWGARFHDRIFVSEPAMRLIAERGGQG